VKLTWFGGTTVRAYLGGEIVVVDAEAAPPGIDRSELVAGADRQVALSDDPAVPRVDPAGWRPRPAPRGIDEPPPAEILAIAPSALLIAAAGEPPLVILAGGAPPRYGRWTDGAVIVLTSGRESLVSEVTVLLDVARPRLIALAADDQMLDSAVAALAEHLDGAGLVSLEPGLAVEV
jgi:hypothetical protein